jgi:hypothetical protein
MFIDGISLKNDAQDPVHAGSDTCNVVQLYLVHQTECGDNRSDEKKCHATTPATVHRESGRGRIRLLVVT